LIFVRSIQQSLGRDATYINAGTAKSSSLFDANGLEAFLSSLDCGNVPYKYIAIVKKVLPPGPPPMTARSYSLEARGAAKLRRAMAKTLELIFC
jgi:hypothetical protein